MRTRKLDQFNDEIRVAYENGADLRLIASTHGVSVGTIRSILIRLGVTLRKQGRPQEKPVYVDKSNV